MNISTSGVNCLICRDSENCSPFKLTCDHAFGKSCMRRWLASSGLKKCMLCTKELSDDEVKQINHIPLHNRMVNILTKVIPTLGKTTLNYLGLCSMYVPACIVMKRSLDPVSVSFINGVVNTPVFIPSATIGALGAAADVPKGFAIVAGAAAGAALDASANSVKGAIKGAIVGACIVTLAYKSSK